jgi:transposase
MKYAQTCSQEVAAAKAGMDPKTARKYLKLGQLPREETPDRPWRTRPDPFAESWPEITAVLEADAGLEAKTIMDWLIDDKPDDFHAGQLRTLQRRVRDWRALEGPGKEVFFRQNIQPGRQSQSDFTDMAKLGITLGGEAFPHLLFHFMLPYSRWEAVSIAFVEDFASLTDGYRRAVRVLGAVAPEHRTDNLQAATHAEGDRRVFNQRWQDFMEHYGVKPTTNNPGQSNENGSVEKSHDLFYKALDQLLRLRGSRNFSTRADYETFLQRVAERRNRWRRKQLEEELPHFQALPLRDWHDPEELAVGVTPWSTIAVKGCIYSVPSRLIGYKLRVRLFTDQVQVLFGRKLVAAMPRQPAGSKAINYRHVVGHLVRKPGAFAGYQFREEMFPRLAFRQAYDRLAKTMTNKADREYLRVLHLAAMGSEQEVALALEVLLEAGETPTEEAVKGLIDARREPPPVQVPRPNLKVYDGLLGIGLACQEVPA